jgi:threonine dehydrogenase-like Zn-dependent dehydrogenase
VKALVFGESDDSPFPIALRELPDPAVRGPAWAVLRTRLTGICGSDTKQVLMDFDDAGDSPMTAFISFPQVLGHEVVATVEEAGPDAGVAPGTPGRGRAPRTTATG